VRTLAVLALLSAALIVAAVLVQTSPDSAGELILVLLLAGLVAAPGVVLLVFYFAIQELIELPARLRDLPRAGRAHAEELARLERETRAARRAAWSRTPLVIWRLLAFLRSSAWIVRPYAPIAAVLSPPMLVAVALSILATVVLVPLALLSLILAVVT
jgi:hypothetical protein